MNRKRKLVIMKKKAMIIMKKKLLLYSFLVSLLCPMTLLGHYIFFLHYCVCTDNHSPTSNYPSGTTGCCTNLHLSRFPWELTIHPWTLQGHPVARNTDPAPLLVLNHTLFGKYMISTELYLNSAQYADKLLEAKS